MKIHSICRPLIIILIYFLFSSHLFAQDPPIIWGEIPRADLEMKTYPADTNASAVVLCDFGESYISERYKNNYKRHLRIKILTTKGSPFGTHSFIIYRNWKNEKVQNIEGITYSINNQGEIVKKELLPTDIRKKEIDSRREQYWLTMPGLIPGCIIEIRYMLVSNDIVFKDWAFQCSEPVRWSEYRILFPQKFGFSAIHQGIIPYTIHENNVIIEQLHYSRPMECTRMRWVIQDAPALREEPFMTSINDYVKKVRLQISGFAIPGFHIGDVLSDWKSAIKEIFESDDFKQSMEGTSDVRELAGQITSGLSSPEEKMEAIYYWVSKSILWSGYDNPFALQEVDDVLETKKGNSAEINFLLLSLLRSAGITADPIVLSTRDNGKIMESYPLLSQFNYILVRASLGSEHIYLDATEPLRPLQLLPLKVLNTKGLVIKKDTVEWVKLSSPKLFTNISAATITIQSNGFISGTFEDMYRDYGGIEVRSMLKDKKDDDIVKESFEIETEEINIDSVYIDAKDSIDVPLKIKAWISSSDYAQCNGDLIYFNPHIIHRMKENPLKSEKRDFPLDYAYPREYSTIINVTIPDSFAIHESVVSRNLAVGANLAVFSRRVLAKENQIRILYKWEIRETEIDTKYYTQMRDFYAQIIAIESEQFVFARMKQPVVPIPSTTPTASTPKKETKTLQKKGKK